MVDVNSPDGLTILIFAGLGYIAGAIMFGLAGWVLALLSALVLRAWGWFYYGFWWDMRYGKFCQHPPSGVTDGAAIGLGTHFNWVQEEDGWWRTTRWYERIIARWVNERRF